MLTTDQRAAVDGASYVITQLRVGQMKPAGADEYLGLRHGLIGQETTGVGGMAKALRTIPVILKHRPGHARAGPRRAAGQLHQPRRAGHRGAQPHAPDVPAVGVCNVAITTKMQHPGAAGEGSGHSTSTRERPKLNTLGLNHLSWHRGFTLDGEDMWPQVLEAYLAGAESQEQNPNGTRAPSKSLGMIPNYYLQYFYYTAHKLAAQEKWPPSRAEQVMEVEKDLLRQYADPSLTEPPADLMKRGGAYYSTLATQLLTAHYNDLGEMHVVNIPNHGAVPGWPADWVLEMPCRVSAERHSAPAGRAAARRSALG